MTFDYQFHLHPSLEPVEYILSHTIFYEDGMTAFSQTFFNSTVELYDPESDFDLMGILQLTCSFVSTIFIAYAVYYSCSADGLKSENEKRKAARAKVVHNDDDWTN
jgi:hypothetical protein